MKNIVTIASKELRSYFVSPIAYVVLTGFLLLGGWFFFNLLARFNFLLSVYGAMQNPEAMARLNLNDFVIAPLLHNLSVVLVILVPVITMRAFAEEKRSGTYELLLTSSFTENQIIAAVSCLVALLMLYVISWPAETAGDVLGSVLKYVSLTEHFGEMVKGVIDTKDLVYFASVILLALFLTQRSVESVRWR